MTTSRPMLPTFDLNRLQEGASDVRSQVHHVYLLLQAIVRLGECSDTRGLVVDLTRQAESLMLIATNDAANLAAELVDIDFGAIAARQMED